MVQWLKRHWLEYVLSAIFTLCAMSLISTQFTYLCDTNDDVLMRNIVSGMYTGTPDAHLVYIMYPLGCILKACYGLSAKIAWYDGFMIGLHYICWFLLAARVGSCFQGKGKKTVGVTLTFLLFALIDLPYMVTHQYTVLAAWLGVVALFWMITDHSSGTKEFILTHIVTVMALLLCLWLRKQVFLMVIPFLALIILYRLYKERKLNGKKMFCQYAGFVGVILIAIVVSFVIDKNAYASEEWKDYLAYNEARTEIYDYYQAPPYDAFADSYGELGYSAADYEVIASYNIGLMPDVDTKTLQTFATWSEEYARWQEQFYSVYRKTVFELCESILYNSVQPIGIMLLMLYAGCFVWAYVKNKKEEAVTVFALALFQCLFVAYFLWKGRFPEHVSYGFYLLQFVFLCGLVIRNIKELREIKKRKECFWPVLIMGIIFIVAVNFGMYRYKTTLDENRAELVVIEEWETIKKYCAEHQDMDYFLKLNAVGGYTEAMFKKDVVPAENTHYLGTWLLNSPLYEERLQNRGISDVGAYLATGGNAAMIQLGDEDTLWLTEFYREQGYTGTIEAVDSILLPSGNSMSVLSMQESSER